MEGKGCGRGMESRRNVLFESLWVMNCMYANLGKVSCGSIVRTRSSTIQSS